MKLEELIEELEKHDKAMTPGPWTTFPRGSMSLGCDVEAPGETEAQRDLSGMRGMFGLRDNAEGVAALRSALPDILHHLRQSLPPADAEAGDTREWKYVTESLPKKDGFYEISYVYDDLRQLRQSYFSASRKRWDSSSVYAWRDAPEPAEYREPEPANAK